ncbi:MAG TPA: helix-turn-helix domain-containing protein, partial [Polyangiaceae bacterium]|nr:helix-turn-helix domain-containing protein [Polyangiaceae bacterium]
GEYELERGELLWFMPHSGHELVSASADFDMWVISFQPELVERVEAKASGFDRVLSARRVPRTRLGSVALTWVEGALLSSFQLLCRGRAPEPPLMAQVLTRLLRETVSEPPNAPAQGVRLSAEESRGDRLHSVTRRARAVLVTEPWLGRAEVAERLRVSESTLAHSFRSDLGVTLDEFRNRVRFGRLLQLLDARPQSLLDAGLGAGFGSAAQYHRSVRALAGCRPGDLTSAATRRALSERVHATSRRSAD